MTNDVQKFSLTPQSLSEAQEYAKLLSESDMVPADFQGKPGNILVAVQMGADVGLSPTQALQNVAVVNGRPAIWGDALLGIVRAHPECDGIHEEVHKDDKGNPTHADCTVKRRGEEPITRTFSKQDAEQAGLWSKKGPWSQYPGRMLQMRARSFAIRDAFADAIKGLSVAEEAQDIPKERDMGPVQQSPKAAATYLNQQIEGRNPEEPAESSEEANPLDRIMDRIDSASTQEELKAAAPTDQEQQMLGQPSVDAIREHYKAKHQELSEGNK